MNTIIFMLPSLSSGGAERVVSIISSQLVEKGNKVIIAVFNKSIKAYDLNPKVDFIQIGNNSKSRITRSLSILNDLRTLVKQYPQAVLIPFQISCLKYAINAKLGTKCSVIACERNDPFHTHNKKTDEIEVKKLFQKADYCVFQTKDARNYYSDIDEKKCSIIPNPVIETNVKWEGNLSDKRIISVCRLTKQKNIYMSLDAVKKTIDQIGSVQYDIFGDGELRDELKQYAEKLGISKYVTFKGVSNNIIEEMKRSSVFVSSSFYEGISNSMLEALSIGMPVICTDCPIGGARMMIDNDVNGVLVSTGDSGQLADAIIKVLTFEDYAMGIAKNALDINIKCSPSVIADRWIKCIERLS